MPLLFSFFCFQLFIWVGNGANQEERKQSRVTAKVRKYLGVIWDIIGTKVLRDLKWQKAQPVFKRRENAYKKRSKSTKMCDPLVIPVVTQELKKSLQK